jgi:hypothetical protein
MFDRATPTAIRRGRTLLIGAMRFSSKQATFGKAVLQ